jgi:hypothetical protein
MNEKGKLKKKLLKKPTKNFFWCKGGIYKKSKTTWEGVSKIKISSKIEAESFGIIIGNKVKSLIH